MPLKPLAMSWPPSSCSTARMRSAGSPRCRISLVVMCLLVFVFASLTPSSRRTPCGHDPGRFSPVGFRRATSSSAPRLGAPAGLPVHASHRLAGRQALAHDRTDLSVGGRLLPQGPGRQQIQAGRLPPAPPARLARPLHRPPRAHPRGQGPTPAPGQRSRRSWSASQSRTSRWRPKRSEKWPSPGNSRSWAPGMASASQRP